MMTLLTLFIEFFKTGLFAVGGGLATIPFLTAMTEKYDWFTPQQLADMIAVAESTPGPIGVNTATFAGFRAAGIPGAVMATFGLVLPSFLVILAIAGALQKYKSNPLVQNAFSGLRPASTGLIAAAGWSVLNTALSGADIMGISLPAVLLFAAIMILSNTKKLKSLHPAAFIGLAAMVGIVAGM